MTPLLDVIILTSRKNVTDTIKKEKKAYKYLLQDNQCPYIENNSNI